MNTHNPLLDALLSKKYEAASRKGVMVYFDLPDLRDMPLGQTDLAIVLSNLLTNAIEAAAQADPPEVYVRMRKSEEAVSYTHLAPYNGEQWAIGAEGAVCLQEGSRVRLEHKPSEGASRAATVFQRLVSAGKRLLRVIEHLSLIHICTPLTIFSTRSTSPPKSAWPGVSTMLILTPL